VINIFEAELEKGSGIPYILIKKNIIGASLLPCMISPLI
jgi:hypothetical protein